MTTSATIESYYIERPKRRPLDRYKHAILVGSAEEHAFDAIDYIAGFSSMEPINRRVILDDITMATPNATTNLQNRNWNQDLGYVHPHALLANNSVALEPSGSEIYWECKPSDFLLGITNIPKPLSLRLEHLATLSENWDSYGASPINPSAIKLTKAVLREMLELVEKNLPLPFIAPSPDGGLELEFETSVGKELILEIPPEEGPITFLLVEPTETGEESETEGTIDDTCTLAEVTRQLVSR